MRIGVFGGTFDPVHNGHVQMAAGAAARFGLQRILFVPARLSPDKSSPTTDARHRIAMLALALAGRPDWTISLEELDRPAPSYTVDTLRAISVRYLHDELWLLMGTDALSAFDRWREPAEIARLARIAAFHREPFVGHALRIPQLPELAGRLDVFDAGSVRISATELREELARGMSPAGRVPGPVAEYITKQALYRSGETRS